MEDLIKYTSTGMKLAHHPEVIMMLQNKRVAPISLQMAPTSKCNLNCEFCSNVNRDKTESLEFKDVLELIYRLKALGLKTVEWTGGGDPTCWDSLEGAVDYCEMLGLEQGLITNGLNLHKYSESFFNRLMWVRISMNCLDYVNDIEIPEMPHTVLGFSYVMNNRTTTDILEKIKEYAREHYSAYVRIVPNCQTSIEKQKENNELLPSLVEKLGDPFFYQPKIFDAPEFCWWCYLKPFVLHDGYVYPCSSVVLNDDSGRSFHSKYRWCTMTQLPDIYEEEMVPFNPKNCDHCVFKPQNEIVDSIINPNGMEDFV